MRVISPLVGESVGQVCGRAYFMMSDHKEPIIMTFNDVTILFMPDSGGLHYRDGADIDHVKVEHVRGLTDDDLFKLQSDWNDNRSLATKVIKTG